MSQKPVEFPPPQGFVLPEGTEPGGDFDLVSTFRMKGDKICLVQMGDMRMPGYDGKDKKENKPDFRTLSEPMIAAGQPMESEY